MFQTAHSRPQIIKEGTRLFKASGRNQYRADGFQRTEINVQIVIK